MGERFELLIVDDDASLVASLRDVLQAEGYSVVVALDGETALALCRDKVFDLALIDIKLPDMQGLRLIDESAKICLEMEYIIITGYASLDTAIVAAGRRDIVAYVTKPLNMDNLLALIRQVKERKLAEKALEAQKELTDRIVASTPNAVLVIDRDLEVVLANRAFYEMFKVKGGGAEGRQLNDVLPLEGLDEAISKGLDDREPQLNLEFRYKVDTSERILVIQVTPMRKEEVLVILRDVTVERAAQEQLYHIDRLATIGELASGIAHELNNPLTGVIGYSELVLDTDLPQEVKRDVEVIHNNAQRAATIVRDLLTFARKQKPEKQYLNVNDLIKHVLQMHGYDLKLGNIEVITEFPDELPGVTVDSQQLEQVFLNIILNAEQAMLECRNRGTLVVKTETRGDMVRISFIDDGPGIPQENLSRVFDPFFTTREPGKGTGLGLSICHGIITEHGGKIYIDSDMEKEGVTFVVELPL